MSDETRALDLDAIRARADAATPGPWHVEKLPYRYPQRVTTNAALIVAETYIDPAHEPAEAIFIAHARTDVPALLAEVERLRAAGDRMAALLGDQATLIAQADALMAELTNQLP